MSFTKKYLCKELCDMEMGVLAGFVDTDRIEKLTMYLFLNAEAIYVTYDLEMGAYLYVIFQMYDEEGITVDIDTESEQIIGYLGDTEIYTLELCSPILDILHEIGEKAWRVSDHYKEQTFPQEDDKYSVKTVNILS